MYSTLVLRLPQVYPDSPGVHVSSPHTLSVTPEIEHPDNVQGTHTPLHGVITHLDDSEAHWCCSGNDTNLTYPAEASLSYPLPDRDVRNQIRAEIF